MEYLRGGGIKKLRRREGGYKNTPKKRGATKISAPKRGEGNNFFRISKKYTPPFTYFLNIPLFLQIMKKEKSAAGRIFRNGNYFYTEDKQQKIPSSV